MNEIRTSIIINDNICKFLIHIHDHIIGDPDAWSVCGLMQSELEKTIQRIKFKKISTKSDESLDDKFKYLKSKYESVAEFSAIPLNNETFDGEFAFIIQNNNGKSYFLWQNFGCESIKNIEIDPEIYIDQLLRVQCEIKKWQSQN